MRMLNASPFPNLRFVGADAEGRDFGVILVKGTYVISTDKLDIADEQAPILFEDRYFGAQNDESSLRIPSDYVARKPHTDIILDAVARAPAGVPSRSWTCGISIEGGSAPFVRRVKVCGPRDWVPTWKLPQQIVDRMSGQARDRWFERWELTEPAEVLEVPIRYELAYGGKIETQINTSDELYIEAYEYNPVGRGWIHPRHTSRDSPHPAHQIADVEETTLAPEQHAKVVGFGPISPAWLPRRLLAGTYDEHWQHSVWPNWPTDYDFSYNNSAHPDMIYPGYLNGAETIVLENLGATSNRRLTLPGHRVFLALDGPQPRTLAMHLDTLFLDVSDRDTVEHRVFLTWRASFDISSTSRIAIILNNGTDTQWAPNEKQSLPD